MISLRNDLPICAIPNGGRLRAVSNPPGPAGRPRCRDRAAAPAARQRHQGPRHQGRVIKGSIIKGSIIGGGGIGDGGMGVSAIRGGGRGVGSIGGSRREPAERGDVEPPVTRPRAGRGARADHGDHLGPVPQQRGHRLRAGRAQLGQHRVGSGQLADEQWRPGAECGARDHDLIRPARGRSGRAAAHPGSRTPWPALPGSRGPDAPGRRGHPARRRWPWWPASRSAARPGERPASPR